MVITDRSTSGSSEDAVYLLAFPTAIKGSALSNTPFGGKLEMVMRMAGIEYEGLEGDVTKKEQAPKGKLPTLKHGNKLVADSSAIFDYLQATFPEKMKKFVSPDEETAAQALVLQRMLEEDVYFAFVYYEWYCDEGFNKITPVYFSHVPYLLRGFVSRGVRKKMIRDLQGQGMGKHSKEEVAARAKKDLAAVNTVLGNKAFLTGDTPSQADCFLFGLMDLSFAAAKLWPEIEMAAILQQQPNLMRFYNSLYKKYCADHVNDNKHWKRSLPQVLKASQ